MKVCPSCSFRFEGMSWECPACSYQPVIIEGYPSFAPELAQDNDGFDFESFSKLFLLEARNFWFRSRNKLILFVIQKYFPTAEMFLEVGCGTTFVMQAVEKAFPKMVCFASEIYSEGLRDASQRLTRTVLFQMDARKIPFEEEFDLVGIFDVLEHIEEDEPVLHEIYRSLKAGGGIIITVPQHPWLWSQHDVYAKHKRRYTSANLISKLQKIGFNITRATSFVCLLLPLMVISRFLSRSSKNYDPTREFKISPLLNFCLEKILDFERLLIKRGVCFPMGGSLLVVAHK
jgi:SAM-dependent methyltransferase